MAINIDLKTLGPNGLPLLRLPRAQPQRATTATTPDPPAAPPTQPERLDPFDVLRGARQRSATRAQIEHLARTWGRQ